MGKQYRILIPSKMNPKPSEEEMRVAWILLGHFKEDVAFVERCNIKTPDFKISGRFWELKSPIGNGARTIDNILRDATKQSKNIILNLSRCKLPQQQAISKAKNYLKINHRGIDRVLLVTKSGKIIDIL